MKDITNDDIHEMIDELKADYEPEVTYLIKYDEPDENGDVYAKGCINVEDYSLYDLSDKKEVEK